MLECWKEKEGKRKGGEDLRLVHRLKQLTASWAWSTIPLSWEHSVTVSFSPNVPTDPGTTQRMRIPAHVNPDDQVGRSSKRTRGEICQPRQREGNAPRGGHHMGTTGKRWKRKGLSPAPGTAFKAGSAVWMLLHGRKSYKIILHRQLCFAARRHLHISPSLGPCGWHHDPIA